MEIDPMVPLMRLALAVGEYFDVPPPGEDEDDLAFVARVVVAFDHPSELIDRLHKSAVYVAKVEEQRANAIAEEQSAKASFLAALLNAVEPALPAITEPLVERRLFVPGQDEQRTLSVQRGVYLVDGWRRDVQDGDAGRSLVLRENGDLGVERHVAMAFDDGRYDVHSIDSPVSIHDALQVFPRKSFVEAVDQLVTKVWRLARNPKRKAQTKESLALADKLAAVRVLLQQGGA